MIRFSTWVETTLISDDLEFIFYSGTYLYNNDDNINTVIKKKKSIPLESMLLTSHNLNNYLYSYVLKTSYGSKRECWSFDDFAYQVIYYIEK